MYLTSALASVLSLALFSTSLLLGGEDEAGLPWLALAAASCFVFAVNLGVQPLPILMASELYPAEHRAFCKVMNKKCSAFSESAPHMQGLSRSLTFLLTVASLKLFPLLESGLQLSGTFLLYSGVLVAGLPLVMWTMPETKDVNIAEINNIFRRHVRV